ncbi:hypothetical protein JJB99_19060 [Bradyrhizobium diazoefficiens]|uniref:hypothetical protein n=1 Tax=Bradyrhizobium diazoefficiens TaxID=1355477 RepID=UPI00190A61B1|nr:hypothetical protein [Bradyrhizobium diazoefficiens]QQO11622.1 hypothetical protein JJB99_19060 [Bradyrhizobium diazoefficiens]
MSDRTQVTLDPETRRRAQAKAAEKKISFAEYVRRLVVDDLGEADRKLDISTVFDLAEEGPETEIADQKDEMIAEAILDVHPSQRGRKKMKLKLKSRRR